jgi:hypothetical protein
MLVVRKEGEGRVRAKIDHNVPVFKKMVWDDVCKNTRSGLSIFFLCFSSDTGACIAIDWTTL